MYNKPNCYNIVGVTSTVCHRVDFPSIPTVLYLQGAAYINKIPIFWFKKKKSTDIFSNNVL